MQTHEERLEAAREVLREAEERAGVEPFEAPPDPEDFYFDPGDPVG